MTTFSNFKKALTTLVQGFEAIYPEIRSQGLDEANLRLSYLDPLFEALGWDIRNKGQAPLHAREVVVEPPSNVSGRKKRPDYLFRIGGIDKFLCEAKRPRQNIDKHYFQIQNYVYNARLWVGVLSDFEYLIIFVVGAQPQKDRPFSPVPNWRLHYSQFEANAQRIWDLLSKENVRTGALERFAQSVPKVTRRGKQGWLIPPDRDRTIDNDFLGFLETERIKLSKLLHDDNSIDWSLFDLTEATQLIIDRLLFQRICEDRNIDVGKSMRTALNNWEAGDSKKGF
ncbi:MAG: type I restriction endonuclease, partial [Rhodospirillales bacterium]